MNWSKKRQYGSSRATSVAVGVAIAREKGITLHYDGDEWRARTDGTISLGFDYLVRNAHWNINPVCAGDTFEVYKRKK